MIVVSYSLSMRFVYLILIPFKQIESNRYIMSYMARTAGLLLHVSNPVYLRTWEFNRANLFD